ncbi:MAG: flagellar hook-length control protein FliK [Terricaulis silvestris]
MAAADALADLLPAPPAPPRASARADNADDGGFQSLVNREAPAQDRTDSTRDPAQDAQKQDDTSQRDTSKDAAPNTATDSTAPTQPKAPTANPLLLLQLAQAQDTAKTESVGETAPQQTPNTAQTPATPNATTVKTNAHVHRRAEKTANKDAQAKTQVTTPEATPQQTAQTGSKAETSTDVTTAVQTQASAQSDAGTADQPTPAAALLVAAAAPAQSQAPATNSAETSDTISAVSSAPRAHANGKAQPLQSQTKDQQSANAASAPTLQKDKPKTEAASHHVEPVEAPTPSSQQNTPQAAAPVQRATAATTDTGAVQAASAPAAAQQVTHAIVRRFNGESTQFQMRLDPPDLGRIDVRLDVSRDHRVTAVISADNAQTLSDLSRASRDLQQALQSAGLDLTDGGLSFDLSGRGDGFAQADQGGGASRSTAASTPASTQTDDTQQTLRPVILDGWRGARIDLVA